MPLYSAAKRDGKARDAYGRRDRADDAASHGCEAPLDDDIETAPPPSAPIFASPLPLVVDLPKSASLTATGDEGSIAASPSTPANGIAGSRHDEMHLGDLMQKSPKVEEKSAKPVEAEWSAEEKSVEESAEESPEAKSAEEPTTEEKLAGEPIIMDQLDEGASSDIVEVLGDEEGELLVGEQSNYSDVVEVLVEEVKPWRSTHSNRGKPAEKLSYHACLPPTLYSMLLDDAQVDIDLLELDPDMHADPEHRWDIANMTAKEALAS
ncbi:unnamed protein product [Closterium sp. NIES-54]